LGALHEKLDSRWIGWPGDVSRFDGDQRAEIDRKLAELGTLPVYLTQTEIIRYYEGFSNGVLWPLFHYLTDIVEREAWRNWITYRDVNRRFAEAVAEHYQPGDLVWVHDYHLLLVPRMLRSLIPEARIGLFLHIPFPSSEVFRILPWREQILKGMLGADVIGFHAYSYLTHFSRALLHVLGEEIAGEQLRFENRDVRLGVFPMGIDAEAFGRLADSKEVKSELESIIETSQGMKLVVGVDRLDHTKGLGRRMLAFERLFEREPSLRKRVRLVQVVVPSRTKVRAYAQLRRELDEIVGRINGANGTVTSAPIHYLYRSISTRELVALYRAAAVMLVTPLRDGMNLVAKEFVASRTDEDGVLVLSEFAGAATELAEALHVNPYDLDRVALAIKEALTMPDDERRTRMRALRRRVRDYDVHRWADSFISQLNSPDSEPSRVAQDVSPPEQIARLSQCIRQSPRLLLLLDYDGTLIPFASTPDLAAPDLDLKNLLRALAERAGTSVHVLSGRTRQTLDRWLGDLPISLHAEHGFWSRTDSSVGWVPLNEEPSEWKGTILPLLEQFTAATPGSLIEQKTAGLAWHYRMADLDFGQMHARELARRLDKEAFELPIDVICGDKVIEIRDQCVNKGLAASRVISGLTQEATVLAMGDDRPDEDLFAAIGENSFAVHVGPRPSRAPYRVADTAAARFLLKGLLQNGM
jgi:trehalose 6-phosphate synthase/phosphatase